MGYSLNPSVSYVRNLLHGFLSTVTVPSISDFPYFRPSGQHRKAGEKKGENAMEEKNKGGRPRLSKLKQPFVKPGTNEVQRIRMGVGAYVQRYTKGGPRCSGCDPQ